VLCDNDNRRYRIEMKLITVNNEKSFEEVLAYFNDSSDSIEVKENDQNLKGIEGNIYGLYVEGRLMYIGERQKGKISSRLNMHLHSCPKGTNSKLSDVKAAYRSGQKVSYKTLLIEPDYQRYALETYLIQNINPLSWNVRDKKKVITFETADDDENVISVESVSETN
jgi:hypothetical protein